MQLKAIIFDWAGTVVDFGSLCPASAFQAAFSAKAVPVAIDDIHRFMGIGKREHIQAVLRLPEVTSKWRSAYGRVPSEQDVDAVYELAERLMFETVASFAIPTPYLQAALNAVQRRGLKIGSTTGYTSGLMDRLAPVAKRKGFKPDFCVASDQVPRGRPWPWMIFKNMERLETCPPASVVKVGDTVADIEEGVNAGVWSVAVIESSSLVGRSRSQLESLSNRERNSLLQRASAQLGKAGAHFLIKNLSELENVLDQISNRLENGQCPPRLARRKRNGLVYDVENARPKH